MEFKESIQDDLNDIFFNDDEFAEIHNIGGTDMTVIIDEDKVEEYKQKRDMDSDGMYAARMVACIRCDDLGYRPAIESSLKVDGVKYSVLNVADSNGIYEILLGVNRA